MLSRRPLCVVLSLVRSQVLPDLIRDHSRHYLPQKLVHAPQLHLRLRGAANDQVDPFVCNANA